jgi:hypothetical protein
MKIVICNRRPIPKNATIPRRNKPSTSRFPFAHMKVGDSFFVKGYSSKKTYRETSRPQFGVLMGHKLVSGSSWSVRDRKEKGRVGVRVWRIA